MRPDRGHSTAAALAAAAADAAAAATVVSARDNVFCRRHRSLGRLTRNSREQLDERRDSQEAARGRGNVT